MDKNPVWNKIGDNAFEAFGVTLEAGDTLSLNDTALPLYRTPVRRVCKRIVVEFGRAARRPDAVWPSPQEGAECVVQIDYSKGGWMQKPVTISIFLADLWAVVREGDYDYSYVLTYEELRTAVRWRGDYAPRVVQDNLLEDEAHALCASENEKARRLYSR